MATDELTEEKREDKAWYRSIVALVVAIAVVTFVALFARDLLDRAERGPDPDVIVTSSLEAMQAQNRLVPFTARFVSVATSRQRRLAGLLQAERTLILPGTARYEVDMAALDRDDLDWDEETATLTVTLPEIEIAGPEVDLEAAREYADEGVLGAVTDVETVLSDANQAAALRDLRRQARGATPMRLARQAAREAIARNFELPLRVAGIENARVVARFASDGDISDERLDVSRRPQDAIDDLNARRAATGD